MSSTFCTALVSFISTFHVLPQLSEAAVAFTKAKVDLGNPSSCIDPATGFSHKLGSKWSIKDTCGKAICEERGTSLYISYSTCGKAEAEYPCKLVQNVDLPYPHCCAQSSCASQFEATEAPSQFEVSSSESSGSSPLDSISSFHDKPVSGLSKIEDEKEEWDHTKVQDDIIVSYDVDTSSADDIFGNYDMDRIFKDDIFVSYDMDTAASDDFIVNYDADKIFQGDMILNYDMENKVKDDMILNYDMEVKVKDDIGVNYDWDKIVKDDIIAHYDVDTEATHDEYMKYDVDTAAKHDEYMDPDLFDWLSLSRLSDSTLH